MLPNRLPHGEDQALPLGPVLAGPIAAGVIKGFAAMRIFLGIVVVLLFLLAIDSLVLGGKYFHTLTIFIDNVRILKGR